MPWPATRVAQMIRPALRPGSARRRLAPLDGVVADDVQRLREAAQQVLLDLARAGEDDERLLRLDEVVDPRHRGAELAAGGEAAEHVELGEALGAQGGGDARLELGELQRLLPQPLDDVLLGLPVLALVVERDGDDDLALGRAAGGAPRDFRRRTKQRRRRCQWMRSSAPAPWKRRANFAPEPKSSSRPRMRSWAISSSGWFITGVPVRASLSASACSVPASLRVAAVRLARGFLT